MRYFKFVGVFLLVVVFLGFFFKGFKVHEFPQLRLKLNIPVDLQGNFCAPFPSWKGDVEIQGILFHFTLKC